jgi:hypothetical protein
MLQAASRRHLPGVVIQQDSYNIMMIKNNSTIFDLLRTIAITGNALFVLWILYNGIDEGSQGATIYQIISYISLIFLLILNSFLLFRNQSKK